MNHEVKILLTYVYVMYLYVLYKCIKMSMIFGNGTLTKLFKNISNYQLC